MNLFVCRNLDVVAIATDMQEVLVAVHRLKISWITSADNSRKKTHFFPNIGQIVHILVINKHVGWSNIIYLTFLQTFKYCIYNPNFILMYHTLAPLPHILYLSIF